MSSTIIDETVILRYLLDDDEVLSPRAAEVIATRTARVYPEIITRVVVTLRDVYKVPRVEIATAMRRLLDDVMVDEPTVVALAVKLFGKTHMDLSLIHIWPLSKSSRRANGKKRTVLRDETSPSTASRPAMNDSTAATAPIRQPAVLAALSALISRTEASAPMHETASDAINSVMLSIVYLDINVIPRLKRIQGVGDVLELGDTYSLRVWMKPDVMSQYGPDNSAAHNAPYSRAGIHSRMTRGSGFRQLCNRLLFPDE